MAREELAIVLDEAKRQEFTQVTRKRTTSEHLAERARIVLLTANESQEKHIREAMGFPRQKAARWQKR